MPPASPILSAIATSQEAMAEALTDYDAAVFGSDVPAEVKDRVNQDRAYSSPIWYSPTQRSEKAPE